jgi:hypothetical protein
VYADLKHEKDNMTVGYRRLSKKNTRCLLKKAE